MARVWKTPVKGRHRAPDYSAHLFSLRLLPRVKEEMGLGYSVHRDSARERQNPIFRTEEAVFCIDNFLLSGK